MQIVKTRDTAAADGAAKIWAAATAKRDDNQPSTVDYDDAVPLLHEVLEHSERSFLLTLDVDGEMLAFAAVEPARDTDDPKIGEVRYLGVAPGRWGEGWARRLLVALPRALREEEFTSAELWVYADNIRAIFVYEALGWLGTDQTRRHPKTNRVEQKFRLRLG